MNRKDLVELYHLLGAIGGSAKALDFEGVDIKKVKEYILSNVYDILGILDTIVDEGEIK